VSLMLANRFGRSVGERHCERDELATNCAYIANCRLTLLGSNAVNVNGLGRLGRRGMQFGPVYARVVGADSTKCTGQGAVAGPSALHGESLAHDGAALGQNLEVGHAPRAGRDMMVGGRGRQRAESGG
jgi:hypothetical protein